MTVSSGTFFFLVFSVRQPTMHVPAKNVVDRQRRSTEAEVENRCAKGEGGVRGAVLAMPAFVLQRAPPLMRIF